MSEKKEVPITLSLGKVGLLFIFLNKKFIKIVAKGRTESLHQLYDGKEFSKGIIERRNAQSEGNSKT